MVTLQWDIDALISRQCDMAFIVPMHHNKPNITNLLERQTSDETDGLVLLYCSGVVVCGAALVEGTTGDGLPT